MSVHPRVTQVATSWPGNFVADSLVLPTDGPTAPTKAACLGTLRDDVVSGAYVSGLMTFTFQPQTIQAGIAVVPSLEMGTASPIVDVAVEVIDVATQSIGIRFRSAVGGAGLPPAAATGAKLHLAIFRPLPVP